MHKSSHRPSSRKTSPPNDRPLERHQSVLAFSDKCRANRASCAASSALPASVFSGRIPRCDPTNNPLQKIPPKVTMVAEILEIICSIGQFEKEAAVAMLRNGQATASNKSGMAKHTLPCVLSSLSGLPRSDASTPSMTKISAPYLHASYRYRNSSRSCQHKMR